MKSIFRTVIFPFLAGILLFTPAHAEDLEMINRPVNTSGLTGLFFTTAPYTQPSGKMEIAASILTENSVKPEYRITEYPLSITVGMKNNAEMALRGSYFNIKEGPTDTATTHRQTGDIELSYKWNFMPQQEYSNIPGIALIITGIAPTENISSNRISSLAHWGLRIGLSTGSEMTWKDHVLGVYADAYLAGQDLTVQRLRDLYEIMNAGLLLPISKYRNLQMFMEYTLVHGKDFISMNGGDYSSFTYGLRLASERFNLTIGTQFLHKKPEKFDNSGRVSGLMSIKF
jgi:hypothetical protein